MTSKTSSPPEYRTTSSSKAPGVDAPVPSLGDLFPELSSRFEAAGIVGLIVIGAPMLAEIERRHGEEARKSCLESLGARVRAVAEERLRSDFSVSLAEPGCDEIMVFLFRQRGSAGFYRTEMPGFRNELNRALQADRGQGFYPYLRGPFQLPAGISVELRNPQFGLATQLRRLINAARHDCLYDAESAKRKSKNELLETILDHRIYSVYEPIVEVGSKTVFGYEALARGPQGTVFHSPVALFTAAEEFELVFELDCVCRESGLRGAVDFPGGTKLFLNIRPTTIHDPAFREDRLIETLAGRGLEPTDVVFEISEQESISSFGAFREMRDYYRSLGFQFALDDTGTGYAGLEELLELEPDYIKIDRSMVSGVDQDPARQDVLAAVLQLAEKMGAEVIGEGLDTLEELEMLGSLGIRFGQGWLFGRPTPLRSDI
ncbi:MAG: EAL domain-containing protein [Myxococcales bacterium]|nr:EAL domain-containing protein [Myxococcales bacterium]HIK84724.1 EAL domain-containing protein [Myxococcales bacterium]